MTDDKNTTAVSAADVEEIRALFLRQAGDLNPTKAQSGSCPSARMLPISMHLRALPWVRLESRQPFTRS